MSEVISEKEQEISKEHSAEIASEEIEASSDEEQAKLRAEIIQIQREFSGPIPHPNIIKGYEDVVKGSANRIIEMAERQAKHRQEMESIMVKSESRDSLLGVIFAFSLGIGALITSVIIVVLVPERAGAISSAILGITGMGSIITGFLKNTRQGSGSSKSQKEKDE